MFMSFSLVLTLCVSFWAQRSVELAPQSSAPVWAGGTWVGFWEPQAQKAVVGGFVCRMGQRNESHSFSGLALGLEKAKGLESPTLGGWSQS